MSTPPSVKASWKYSANHWVWIALDWIYPPFCACCQLPGTRLCSNCIQKFQPINHETACPVCDLPGFSKFTCPDCAKNPPAFTALRSYGQYQDTLRTAIHKLKFERDLGLGEVLADLLEIAFNSTQWNIDAVTAVPLGAQRLKERDYNQARIIGELFASKMGIPFFSDFLVRSQETTSQVELTAAERRVNVHGAFSPGKRPCSGKNILVVDDIATTGSTLSACANELINHGAGNVYALTLARAVHLGGN